MRFSYANRKGVIVLALALSRFLLISAYFRTVEVSTIFHEDAVKHALEHHQKSNTPYENFLKDIASAGVNYYLVDMTNRVITYTSGKADETYIQSIPK